MSYTFYKVLHLAMVLIFLSSLTASYCLTTHVKKARITSMIASFILLVAGFGLMARLGMMGLESWPLWLKIKLGLWLLVSVGAPIVARKCAPEKRGWILVLWVFVFLLAMYFGVTKPV